jgi:hypothetical protein
MSQITRPLKPPPHRPLPRLHRPGTPPRPYKSHPDDPRSIPHLTELLSSPLPRRNSSPPRFPDHHRAAASPGRHTTARAPVRPEPSSPCSPLSVALPSVSFSAPEWLEVYSGERATVLRRLCSAPPSVHGGPRAPARFIMRGSGPRHYPLKNNSLFWVISDILHLGPLVSSKSTRSP